MRLPNHMRVPFESAHDGIVVGHRDADEVRAVKPPVPETRLEVLARVK